MKTKRLIAIFMFGVCIIAGALFLGVNTANAAKAEQTLDNLNEIPKYESNLIKIEILRGMSAYIDLTQKTGEVEIYEEDGTFTLANYKITQTDNGEYITFVREPKHNYNSEILELNPKTHQPQRYWKSEVIRTYPKDSVYPTYIIYSENGPYGYASGTLYWYAIGIYIGSTDYHDIWYQGFLYYGEITPFSIKRTDF